MSDSVSINSLFKTKQSILESKLSILLGHPVTKGDQCESAWIDFFRSFLPNKYAVDKGYVFDSEGTQSQQIDVIIYDALYTPLIFGTDAGEKFITAESVYAVFESKPEIKSDTLKYANEKIRSVTSLKRTSREMVNSGIHVKPRVPPKIIGGILAIDSVTSKTLYIHLKTYPLIDVGCAIRSFSFLARREANTDLVLQSSTKEETILSFFYIILDELFKMGTVAAIDIRNYTDITVNSVHLDRSKDEYPTKIY